MIILENVKKLLKHSRLGDLLDTIIVKPFDECQRLCPGRAVKEYVAKTAPLRKGNMQLLISFVRPHGPVSRDTIARWMLLVLQMSAIDTSRYAGHSTRGAAASARNMLRVSINLIMRQAGCRNESSFAMYCNKDLEQKPANVGQALLSAAV